MKVKVSGSRYTISWAPPSDDGGKPITNYKIESAYKTSSGREKWHPEIVSKDIRTYEVVGLAGVSIYFRVSAGNTDGFGLPSDEILAVSGQAVKPDQPINLVANAAGVGRINLSWKPPYFVGSQIITGYKIEVSANAGASWTDLVVNTSSTETTYAHSGLGAGITRHYRVSAINSVGAGSPSNVANATTDAAEPGSPTSLTAT
ncbi:MAG: fibronectin type III domain-containing protein, partial [Rhodothermaceae bacterium]|nr:fibronectin type III domain-containing protein [Rhodothermaceae bacterium]